MTISLWQRGGPLSGRRVDAAVVGAGIAGLSAAHEFERAGLSCVVLERRSPAAAASGRNAGFLMRGAADNYAAGVREHGRETASALWRWTEENLADLRSIGVEGLPGYAGRASCLLALDEREEAELVDSASLLEEDGFTVSLVRPGDRGARDTIWSRARPRLGLLNPGDAVCNPLELVGLLCARLESTEVFTGCDVVSLTHGERGMYRLETGLGTLLAARVFVATNAAAGSLLSGVRGLVTPNRGQMLAAHCEGVELEHAYYANHGSEYLRQLDRHHVLVGGARLHEEAAERTESEAASEKIQARLEGFVREWLTGEFEVVSRWAGVMGFSKDRLPMAGAVGIGPPRSDTQGTDPERAESGVWFCGGFTGHGMSMGHRTAALAARAMLGGAELPGWLRIERFARAGGAGLTGAV